MKTMISIASDLRNDSSLVSSVDGAREFASACHDLARIVEALGSERAFMLVRCAWPTLSRETLDRMLLYSENPNARALSKLVEEFAAAMTRES